MDNVLDGIIKDAFEAKKRGCFEKAKDHFYKVIRVQPRHAEANFNIGVFEMASKNISVAEKFLKIALEEDPQTITYWKTYIDVLIRQGDIEEASKILAVAHKKGAIGKDFKSLEQRIEIIKEFSDLYEKGFFRDLIRRFQQLDGSSNLDFATWFYFGAAQKELEQFDVACNSFKKVLFLKNDFPAGYNNLAISLMGLGDFDEAILNLNKAINLQPDYPEAFNNLGIAFQELGDIASALESFKNAIDIKPDYAEAVFNLANIYKEQKNHHKAISLFKKALKIKPTLIESYEGLAFSLMEMGEFEKAVDVLVRLISINPKSHRAINALGLAFIRLNQPERALQSLSMAQKTNCSDKETYNNMGIALNKLGQFQLAQQTLERAIALDPNYADAYGNLAIVLKNMGKFNEAKKTCSTAISISPEDVVSLSNLAVINLEQGEVKQAIKISEKAISIDPNYPDAHYNLSLSHLMDKNFEKGFDLYEKRWTTESYSGSYLNSEKPQWSGELNKKVLLWAEQGIGDEVMFSSMVPELTKLCSNLIVLCDYRLIPLFQRSFSSSIEYVSKFSEVVQDDYDFHLPMGSLGKFFRRNRQSFEKSNNGYLRSNDIQTKYLRDKLKLKTENQLIGLSWFSKSPIPGTFSRNIGLDKLVECLNNSNIQFVNLQYGDVRADLKSLYLNTGIKVHNEKYIDNKKDLGGLASLIMACDHVVSIDNATVHLAGALGKATSVLLPSDRNWRWGKSDQISYWYKSVKLFQKKTDKGWGPVLSALKHKLDT